MTHDRRFILQLESERGKKKLGKNVSRVDGISLADAPIS